MAARNVVEVIVLGKDQASSVIGTVGGAISGLGTVAAGVATGGLALAAAAVVGLGAAAVGATIGVTKLALAAAGVEGTRQTFVKLGGDIDSLKEATRGMVAEADLMAASNKFLTMGITETADETANMAEMATQLGMAMNVDATKSMEDFALMMANQSIPRLDTFGISSSTVRERMKELMKTTDASGISQGDWDERVKKSTTRIDDLKNKLYLAGIKQSEWTDKTKESTKVAHAQRIDKITQQLIDEEIALANVRGMTVGLTEATEAMTREEAFKIAVLEQGAVAMEKVGEQGESSTATTLRWAAAIDDLKLGIGQAFIPALEAIRKPVLELVDKYGPKVVEWANVAGEWLGEKLPEAIETLEALWMRYWPEASSTLTNFWNTIRPGLEWVRDMFQAFQTNYLPGLRAAWDILKEGWDEISEIYRTQLKPALEELWTALGIGEIKSDAVGGAMGAFAGILAQLAASNVIGMIKGALEGLIWALELGRHWGIVFRDVFSSMLGVFNEVRHWIEVLVEKFDRFKSTLSGFELPWWLTPGSPTPLETGLAGIGKALAEVQGLSAGGLFLGAGGGAGGGDTRTVSNNLTMNVQTRATTGQVVMGFETMRALV